MGKSLVIVESPAKARTIDGYLGSDYAVGSSVGHVRDLPDRARDVPEAQRKRFGALGVDVNKDFEPYYVVDPEKKKIIADLKKRLADADELLLATDEDREGEAIAWHLVQVLKPKVPVRRMVFHEITKDAITRALEDTREHRRAPRRRAGDAPDPRSPVRLRGLARAVEEGDAAGSRRVACSRWRRASSCSASASAWRSDRPSTGISSRRSIREPSRLASSPWTALASRRGRTSCRRPASSVRATSSTSTRRAPVRSRARLEGAAFAVRSVDERPYRRKPAAPFRTATLQQEASRKLRFSAQTTMRVAQRLYESGLHHVHAYRLDDAVRVGARRPPASRSPALRRRVRPGEAAAVRTSGRKRPGGARGDQAGRRRVPDSEGARERARTATSSRSTTSSGSARSPRRWRTRAARRSPCASARRAPGARTSSSAPRARSSLSAASWPPTSQERTSRRTTTRNASSRSSSVGQEVSLANLEPDGHSTVPPARYTEPTLVRALEERGIGRPSTYAAILSTIVDRGYVFKKGTALVPTFVAFAVVNLLERHFEQLVDFDFTARMEDDLDRIAAGDESSRRVARTVLLRRRDRPRAPSPRDRSPRRDRRAGRELDRDPRIAGRRPRRPLRPVPRERRAAREPSGGPRTRRADAREGRGAPVTARQQATRGRPGDTERDRRPLGPVRAVRHGGPHRRHRGETTNRFALLVDVARDGDARGRSPPPVAPDGSSASSTASR